jgi:parallel beta-helix repeat protein
MPCVFVYPETIFAKRGQDVMVTVGVYNLTDNVYSSNYEWVVGGPLPPYDPSGVHRYPMGYLVGFDVKLSWDPNVLEYKDRTVTVPFESYPNPIPPLNFTGVLHWPITQVRNVVNPTLGTYWLARASGIRYFNGNGTLFQMTFTVKNEGSSALTLSDCKLSAPPNSQWIGKVYNSPGIIPNRVINGFLITPKTIYVDDDNVAGPWLGTRGHPYQNITSGMPDAESGDTIQVLNGTYYEGVHINKSLNIVGESPAATIIDGHVEINANGVQFRGFTVQSGTGGVYGAGLMVYGSSGCLITNNLLTLCFDFYGDGMFIATSNNNTISENLITRNKGNGIEIDYSSSYNWIVNNTVSYNSACGIAIMDWGGPCIGNLLIGNDMQFNELASLGVPCWGRNTKIINNRMANSYEGIHIYDASYKPFICEATINENWIANCRTGIIIDDQANNNIITDNTIMNCTTCGMRLRSSNNIVYRNNFIKNAQPVDEKGVNTVWDDGYPSGGNYWSDYNGTDANFDGIGDTPYIIDGNNTDNYPLMYPRPFFYGDINCDCQVDIYDVTAVCIAYDSKPEDPNWYPPADISPPYGIIDIYDVTAVCITYGEQWPY